MASCSSCSTPMADPDASLDQMQVTREEILQCALPSWYEQFKKITIKTVLIDLSQEFIDYLNSDGCFLPKNCSLPAHAQGSCSDSDSDQEEWSEERSEDSESETEPPPAFPELTEKIESAIETLGGAVIPKLNWSSPRDATWISPENSLRCTCPAEVFLLLKSSDFVSHDLSRVFEYCKREGSSPVEQEVPMENKYTLCLRQWTAIHPSSEFRCFVHRHQLIAISQRNYCAYYRHLAEEKEEMRHEIVTFYSSCIAKKFPNPNYVFDVYRISQDNFLLVDFNPFCPATDPLLFSWEELTSEIHEPIPHSTNNSNNSTCDSSTIASSSSVPDNGELQLPVIRVVDGGSIQPSDLQRFRLPKDIVDLSSGDDITEFVELFKTQNATQSAEPENDKAWAE